MTAARFEAEGACNEAGGCEGLLSWCVWCKRPRCVPGSMVMPGDAAAGFCAASRLARGAPCGSVTVCDDDASVRLAHAKEVWHVPFAMVRMCETVLEVASRGGAATYPVDGCMRCALWRVCLMRDEKQ